MTQINLTAEETKIAISALANYLEDIAKAGNAMIAKGDKTRSQILFESGKKVDALMKKIAETVDTDIQDQKNDVKEELIAQRIKRRLFGGRK